jgi:predicted nucleic acid-binding protein
MTGDRPRFGLDTNVLVYAIDTDAGAKSERAEAVVRRAVETGRCIISVQNIGEFYNAVARRRLVPLDELARRAMRYMQIFALVEPRAEDARAALAEAAAGRFSYWDALLLATLGRAGCSALLSEDMHDGGALGGVTVRDPFLGDALPDDVAALLG